MPAGQALQVVKQVLVDGFADAGAQLAPEGASYQAADGGAGYGGQQRASGASDDAGRGTQAGTGSGAAQRAGCPTGNTSHGADGAADGAAMVAGCDARRGAAGTLGHRKLLEKSGWERQQGKDNGTGLEQATFGKAHQPLPRDHEVIEHAHVHEGQGLLEGLGDRQVGGGRFGMAAGMVVGQHDRGSVAGEGLDHDLAGVNGGLGERSPEHLDHGQDVMLRVQKHYAEDFVGAVGEQQAQVVAHGVGGRQHVALADVNGQEVEGVLDQGRAAVAQAGRGERLVRKKAGDGVTAERGVGHGELQK